MIKLTKAATLAGFDRELEFWDKELSLKGDFPENIRKRLSPEELTYEFPSYTLPVINELTGNLGRPPKLLDVGSGPLSMFGYAAYHRLIELVAVDPLADQYNRLRDKYGIRLINYQLRQGFGENLSKVFVRDSFDIVWIHNALDHSQDPVKVVHEMFKVLRPGGYFYFAGWCREGTTESWYGLHQHDIFLAPNGHLMCTTRTGHKFRPLKTRCLNAGLALKLVEGSKPTEEVKQWISLLWQKI